MTPYRDSLWSQAPEGATHWGISYDGLSKWFVQVGDGLHIAHPSGGRGNYDYSNQVTDLHERPAAYQSPAQLIEAYRREHGPEIEADVKAFITDGPIELQREAEKCIADAAFFHVLIEHLLAAERARVEADAGGGS